MDVVLTSFRWPEYYFVVLYIGVVRNGRRSDVVSEE